MAETMLPCGAPLRTFTTICSTNAEAARCVAAGTARSGTWFVADSQTAGVGRLGRRWASPPGNLHASVVLPAAALPGAMPFAAALALHDTVAALHPAAANLALKWPNDLTAGGAKLGGILIERVATGGTAHAIVGFGLNLAHAPAAHATSLAALGRLVTPADALVMLAAALRQRCAALDDFAALRSDWLALAAGLGEPIAVAVGGRIARGIFAGLDDSGGLVVREAGGICVVTAGDVLGGGATTQIAERG